MPSRMRAQTSNQAALVIRHAQNDVRTACVEFDEPQISGYELLARSGYDIQIDVQGLGSLICSIGDTGCPPNDCLCQCKGGGDCIYWSYWHRLDNSWQYSQGGANVYMVDPGTIEGWSWGPGAVNQAYPPPQISFDEVCQAEPTNTPTSSPTATNTRPALVITPQVVNTQESSVAVTATATSPSVSGTNTPVPEPTATNTAVLSPTAQTPNQTAAATATVQPVTLPQETPLPTAAATEEAPQIAAAAVQELDDSPLATATPVVVQTETMTPAPVAIVQRAKSEPAAITPQDEIQAISEPVVEPTAALQVIGEGIVPAPGFDAAETDITIGESRELVNADVLPYLSFLVIVAGLGGLLALVSLRRRKRQA